jgi:N-formylglutamate amidohydrolase
MNAYADSNTPDTGERPDISLCTERGEAADDDVIDAMQRVFEQSQFEHRKNDPYAGGYTTNTYADPSSDIHGVQIEVNKSCYMDETTLEHDQVRAGDLKSVLQTAKKAGLAVLENQYANKRSGGSKV